jgi:hypothetical protein
VDGIVTTPATRKLENGALEWLVAGACELRQCVLHGSLRPFRRGITACNKEAPQGLDVRPCEASLQLVTRELLNRD